MVLTPKDPPLTLLEHLKMIQLTIYASLNVKLYICVFLIYLYI